MRKHLILMGASGLTLVGFLVGVAMTVHMDWADSARAVEPVVSPAVQPAAFFSNSPSSTSTTPSFANLAEKVGPAVVNISTTKIVKRGPGRMKRFGPRDPFFDDFFEHFFETPSEAPVKSLGSGFIINAEGYILTNNHVIEGADEIQVTIEGKRKYNAKVVGSDAKTDIAVIKITDKANLPFVPLGDSDRLRVGDWVMAVGNPFGLDHTVTVGIVSAKGRVIGAGPYDDFIQTDASINPGNSGGPLFNLQGEVVGVNTAIVASGQGIGFAIPINISKQLVPQLISTGKVTRAWLGVGIQDITPELAKSFGLPTEKGALISNVFPGSPADKGGIKSGDVITAFNGKEINESHELPNLVAQEPVGKESSLKVLREGKTIDLKVTLGEMEKGERQVLEGDEGKLGSPELGLACRDLTPDEKAELGVARDGQGVLVVGVQSGSAAEQAGVQRGDLILSVNNNKISNVADLTTETKKIKKGDIVRLFIRRRDATVYLAFTK